MNAATQPGAADVLPRVRLVWLCLLARVCRCACGSEMRSEGTDLGLEPACIAWSAASTAMCAKVAECILDVAEDGV